MCRAMLAFDERFSNVRPRHPRGGPDGGRDIEALFKDSLLVFDAVSFNNQANDSNEQKTQRKSKFKDDAESALSTENTPEYYIFMTNINLTIGEKGELIEFAKDKGLKSCEVFDRERLRIAWDSPDGFSIKLIIFKSLSNYVNT